MKLTKLEKRLLECMRKGDELDLEPHYDKPESVPETVIAAWGSRHTIRASVIREIMRGTVPDLEAVDPRGLQLRGARISGRLDLEDVECLFPLKMTACYFEQGIDAESAIFPRLELRYCVIEASVESSRKAKIHSAVCLTGARINGRLSFTGSLLKNQSGPALLADRLLVEGDLFLREKFRSNGAGEFGAVRLTGAIVRGRLDLSNAVMKNETGPALSADGLVVDGDLRLDEELRAFGNGEHGAVRLLGTKIGGQLSLSDAILTNETGPALLADRLSVDGDLFLDGNFCACGSGEYGAVRLKGAKVCALHIGAGILEKSRWGVKWVVDGLSYEGCPTEQPKAWLKFLKKQTLDYAAQPYQQLAHNFFEAGHDSRVRKTLITQRFDQLRRGKPGVKDWLWGAFTGITVGFGYLSWLPIVWLIAIFAVVYCLVTRVYSDGLASTSELKIAGADPTCTGLEQFQMVVDMVVPLVSTGVNETCQVVARVPDGEALAIVSMVAQGASWALLTLFVAGFTGIIRRN
ncbi:hypothetical protein [Glutamicibacter soli]|uniref:hypothetical protein n=1 Tax=Glutamicibacter soli TaxID=453836 RepID=UPI0011BFB174|nr:hypothetical protein [Glutamicibacter soli]